MSRDPVLKVTAKFLIPLIMLFALYVPFHGEYSPGGGFQARVIFASAVMLYGLVFGVEQARQVLPVAFMVRQAGAGVLLFGVVGVVSRLRGGEYLNYLMLAADPMAG